jgi:Tol biopolymer transport system component
MSRVSAVVVSILILTSLSCAGKDDAPMNPYMGQTPPGMTPEVFAPGLVSSDEHEFAPSFSPDGTEFYFSRGVGQYSRKSVMVTRQTDGSWSEPVKALTYADEHFEGRVHPDGQRIFFMGFHVVPGKERPDLDMFFAERAGDGWGEATHLGSPFNPAGAMYISFTEGGTMYTSGVAHRGIVISRFEDGEFSDYEPVGPPVDTDDAHQVYPFIAPDGSYLIFSEMGGTRGGESSLLVAFRGEDGSWTEPREIPLGMRGGTASVSPDGKYLFFTADRPGDIYWVDAGIFQKLRTGN